MGAARKVGSLEIEQDLDFQNKDWAVQRVGWVVLALLMAATLLGLFGEGLLSPVQASDSRDVLQVEYPRFYRTQSQQSLQVQLEPEAVQNQEARLWISQDYLNRVQIERVEPQPQSVVAEPDGVTYVFDVSPGSGPVELIYYFKATGFGAYQGELGLAGAEPVEMTQIVYP